MPKIVMINVGAHGHINPTIPVIGELVKRGATVHYFAPEEFRAAITREGGVIEPYDTVFGKVPPPTGASQQELMAQMPGRLTAECLHTLPQIESRLGALKPDLIIYDKFCLAARLLCQSLNIPGATFLPSYAANEHFNLGKLFGGRTSAPNPDHPALVQFRKDAEQINQRFGVKFNDISDLFRYTPGLNICFVARDFQYEGQTFDDRFVFVGPCFTKRDHEGEWSHAENDPRPVLFISLGTVFNNWPEFFKICFEAFGGIPWRVVMATGKQVKASMLGTPPDNFEIAEHQPQLEILEQADVFVTHGGMNSTMESLWFGVPMVVVPQMSEQTATAMRVDELGLGIRFTRENFTAVGVRDAVEKLKSDAEVHTRIQAMQRSVRSSGGQAKAAEAILNFITQTTKV